MQSNATIDKLPVIHPSHTHWRREDMPQIDDVQMFQDHLRKHFASFRREDISPAHLHATQNEINLGLVFRIISSGINTHAHPIIVSKDNHILDGHNRWYAALILRIPVHCIVVDREIRSLLHLALAMPNVNKLSVNNIELHKENK